MKLIQTLCAALILASSAIAAEQVAQQGFMPGEPDPNYSPRTEQIREAREHAHLIDDRAKCPRGKRRFEKMICAPSEKGVPSCEKPVIETECRRAPRRLKCGIDEVPVAVFKCPK